MWRAEARFPWGEAGFGKARVARDSLLKNTRIHIMAKIYVTWNRPLRACLRCVLGVGGVIIAASETFVPPEQQGPHQAPAPRPCLCRFWSVTSCEWNRAVRVWLVSLGLTLSGSVPVAARVGGPCRLWLDRPPLHVWTAFWSPVRPSAHTRAASPFRDRE